MVSDGPEWVDVAEEPESSFRLLQRAQAGNREAVEQLMERYLPRLKRWASGRLPREARDLVPTPPISSRTRCSTRSGASRRCRRAATAGCRPIFRQAVMNGIRDELRRARRRPRLDPLGPAHPHPGPSPLELAIGKQTVDRYERALAALKPQDREAVVARIDLGCTYSEIAGMLASRRPTPPPHGSRAGDPAAGRGDASRAG